MPHTTTPHSGPPPPPGASLGALPTSERSLAPDLARGVMLLIIATVHAHMFRVATTGDGYSLDGALDITATAAMALFGENRGYPMFAALFGYGLAGIYLRRTAEGRPWPWTRGLLRRRGRWMVVIGVAHTALLFYGDVIAVYGLLALLFASVLRFSDRRLLAHAFAWMAAGSLGYALTEKAFFAGMQESGDGNVSALLDMVMRLMTLPLFWPMMIAISVFPFLIGVWAARRRLLEDPQRHRALLRRVALWGISTAVVGGVPQALINIELWDVSVPAQVAFFWLHLATGYAGGFGYAALIALVALRLGQRRGPIVTALAATGQRSMTCYLLQSVAWAVLIPPYALGIGPALGDAEGVALGAAVWLATVVAADLMRRAGFRQGPAEWFLRRMTYGRPAVSRS
ncbi:DUF418 domain-containing protein [Marinactinospora thermotolerans]|uniref:Uncharacterized membrane protein YeiB n=1 Tax=Marinactinospora thermotolerans DSM 45154 TaxID=1122192 RepID=A0A1T4SS49_9ACTN|nr:DUF418 domain-containing protein [Marinactinospora thermotolerans]SKA30728.1 Uncharacterized membrane protein YeiB [Marinactinospora thermotolerans DSM 45154]